MSHFSLVEENQKAETVSVEMDIEHVKDGGGHPLTLQKVNGRYFPIFPTDIIKNMVSLKIRPDDIILAGYLKSGTHWVWEMVRMLLQSSTHLDLMEKDVAMMESSHQTVIDALPSRRVLNTHVLFDQLPKQVRTAKPKILYLTRNPKDIAVSLYNHHIKLWDYYHYQGSFQTYLPLFLDGKVDYGSWFSHIESWSECQQLHCPHNNISIMEVNYEDLSQNPTKLVSQIAQFIDVTAPNDLIDDVVTECTIQRMRQRKGQFDLDDNGQAIMYRKGQVGDWKHWFTVTQNECFDQVYQAKMATIDTKFHWRFCL